MAIEGVADIEEIIGELAFDAQDMIAVIAQDWRSGNVLMMAWMNAEAIRATVRDGVACYWSRSDLKIWRKGEKDGRVQYVKSFMVDGDRDTILLQVEELPNDAMPPDTGFYFYHIGTAGRYYLTGRDVRELEQVEY